MFEFNCILCLQKFNILFLIIIFNQNNNTHSYGPTTNYRSLWKNDEHINENEIYSQPVLKRSIFASKLPSFGVVPELLSDLSVGKFIYKREFSPKLSQIYSKYLKNDFFTQKCSQESGESPFVSDDDFDSAFRVADQQIKEYEIANQQYLAADPRGLNFSAYIYVAGLHSKYNELVTEYLSQIKCFDKYKTALIMPSIEIPPNPWNNHKYCDIERPDSAHINCNQHEKYSRIDGKCNNPFHANWGSSFHCHRRLLPPDYSDGIEIPRKSSDGTELPNPRLITEVYMPDIPLDDPKRTSMHMIWGQFVVHDTFKTLQYLGLAIRCCSNTRAKVHPECLPITNIPPDKASVRFNQRCINTVRSTACNTCSLGPRNQINGATSTLDLSNVYGGNLMNNSNSLRTYIGGRLRVSMSADGNEILPVTQLPRDQDNTDLTECNPPLDRPWLSCFHNGDGIRGNQNPMVNAIHVVMTRRHNQHAIQLSKVNPHWSDEIIFQEARRILIAEYNKINFGEYLPSLLGKRVMDYYELEVRKYGYTKYNPKLDPSTIQSVGVAALRMGHSQIASLFRVIQKPLQESFGFKLRDKFFEMSDIFDGFTTGLIKGLVEDSDRNVDPFIVNDVKDFLFFNPRRPTLTDLPAININRGRDHGVAAYVYYLQYCTGILIDSWSDLYRFIPIENVKKLRSLYKHYKDIDLFVGGISELHLKGSLLGPTFSCLNAIQFYHWKYGDRFYFEHGGQTGTFTPEQLKNIRQSSSLANLLCKTNEMDSIQANPMFSPSYTNPKISCHTFPDLDYELWRDLSYY